MLWQWKVLKVDLQHALLGKRSTKNEIAGDWGPKTAVGSGLAVGEAQ